MEDADFSGDPDNINEWNACKWWVLEGPSKLATSLERISGCYYAAGLINNFPCYRHKERSIWCILNVDNDGAWEIWDRHVSEEEPAAYAPIDMRFEFPPMTGWRVPPLLGRIQVVGVKFRVLNSSELAAMIDVPPAEPPTKKLKLQHEQYDAHQHEQYEQQQQQYEQQQCEQQQHQQNYDAEQVLIPHPPTNPPPPPPPPKWKTVAEPKWKPASEPVRKRGGWFDKAQRLIQLVKNSEWDELCHKADEWDASPPSQI